jgi:hypothetical protein
MGVRTLAAWATVAAGLVAVTSIPPAGAAGIVTHAWMAEEAAAQVADPALAALLRANADQLRAGSSFPDGGYATRDAHVTGGDFGEEAHWQRFHDSYLAVLRARPDCGDIGRPDGPCAGEVAHLMGVAAHGMGDEVWDWLFEPAATDHGELWIPAELTDVIHPGGIEVQMDVIAIADHARAGGPSAGEPSVDDLMAAFAAAGRPDITPEALAQGRRAMDDVRALEIAGAPAYRDAVHTHMPWTAANMDSAPGGVRFAARAIAAVYETLWEQLQGRSPVTRVTVTAPADGELDVPARGWVRTYRPGAVPDGGGARNRIVAALSSGLPYVHASSPPGTSIDPRLPTGSAVLAERDSGRVVPQQDGFPRIMPYDPNNGEHLVAVQPAGDLSACTWYQVSTTDRLRDADDRPVADARWSFRTDGCAPEPTSDRGGDAADGGDHEPGVAPPAAAPAAVPVAVRSIPRFVG